MNASEYNDRLKTTGRNDPCPCGSGKKYKKCHLAEDEAAKHAELSKAAEEREAAMAAADSAEDTETTKQSDSGKPRRGGFEKSGKAKQGQDTHSNIPRRGAV